MTALAGATTACRPLSVRLARPPGPIARSRWSRAVRDDEVLNRLRRLSLLARSADDPCVLAVDDRGARRSTRSCRCCTPQRRSVEGLEAAWLGKGRSLIVRLAGVWSCWDSIDGKRSRPGAIGAEQVEAAAALWRSYFWPHARGGVRRRRALGHKRRVRRVARWLLDTRPATVSRDEIRRRALSLSATGRRDRAVLQRLHYLGYVQPDLAYRDRPGRPTHPLAGQSGPGRK